MRNQKQLQHYFFISLFISLWLLFGCYNHSQAKDAQGWLVVLDGTSSAGKSSVARYLKKKLFDETKVLFSYESLDDFNTRKEAEKEKKTKSASTTISSKKSMDTEDTQNDTEESSESDQPMSSESGSMATSDDDDDDDDDSQEDYLQYIKDLADQGKNVIGDTVLRDDQDVKEYKTVVGKGKKNICALVYCPAREITRRVEARNLSGNKDEERTLYQAIAQLPDMFTITKKQTKKTIDSITKRELEAMLKPLKKELEDDNKKKRKEGKKEDNVPETLRTLRAELSPKRGDCVYLQPKMKHDVAAINSRAKGPAAAAQKIADFVIKRMHKKGSILIDDGSSDQVRG
jgi:predicted kinase